MNGVGADARSASKASDPRRERERDHPRRWRGKSRFEKRKAYKYNNSEKLVVWRGNGVAAASLVNPC